MTVWYDTTLGEVVTKGGGSFKTGPFGTTLKASEYSANGVPVISVGEVAYGSLVLRRDTPRVSPQVTERLPEYVLNHGDIVFGRKGAVDRSAWVQLDQHGWFLGSDGIRARLTSLVDSRFIAYQLQGPHIREWLLQHASGSTLLSLNQTTLSRVPLVMPPLEEQGAIAKVLGALDDKIAANTKESGLIDEFITARFRAAFVGGQVQSVPLFEAMAIDFGEAFKGTSFSAPGEGRPLIRIRDLKTFSPQIWTIESRAREVTVMSGDIVVGMDAEFRATTWLAESGLLNQRVCRVRGHGLGNAFVREALRGPLAAIENQKSATTVIHLNKSDMERMEIEIPDAVSLRSFEDDAEHLYLLRVKLELENRTLAATRDALLPQLMSGKLRVSDGEENLEVAR